MKRFQRKCVTLWGRLTASTKLKYALRQPFAQQKQLFTRVFSGSGAEPATKKKKRMMKRNFLTTNHFGGGNSVFTGLASIFHTSTKRRLLSCAKAIIAVFFALFATGCTRYEYINLTDEDEESAPIDTTTRGNQGSSFDFDTCDSEPIDVDLNPQK